MVIRSWHELIARGVLLAVCSTAACAADPSSAPGTVRAPEPSNADDGDDNDVTPARADAGKKPAVADAGASDRPATGTTQGDGAVAVLDGRAASDVSTTDAGTARADGSSPMAADPASIWIAPSGSDQNPGTQDQPLKTLSAAHERALPGTTIWVSPGSYAWSETVRLTRAGEAEKPIRIHAAPGARPLFDFAAQPRGESAARGLQISGSYWHIRGIDVVNAGDNCIHISGSHNTIEHVVTHGCFDTGIQITANGSEAADPTRAAHNTILNCDSYENYDGQNQGENADGFAAKLYIGPGNVFRGCRAWNNSDDGWDLFASDDVVVIENCWAMSNGKIGATQSNTNGDGNGFKLGGAAKAGDANQGGAVHQVKDCISISNRACGFVRNNNTKVPELDNTGGQGDGKGTYCSLTTRGAATVSMTAAQAIAAARDVDGNLPKMN